MFGFLLKKKTHPKSNLIFTDNNGEQYNSKDITKLQQKEHPNNPRYFRTQKERDMSSDFFVENFDEIQKRKTELSDCYAHSMTSCKTSEKIELLNKSLEMYKKFRDWCYKSKGGKIYFDDKYKFLDGENGSVYSKEDQIINDLNYNLHIQSHVIPLIIDMCSKDGILQKNLYRHFPDLEKKSVKMIVDELTDSGIINKVKSGNTYLLTSKTG